MNIGELLDRTAISTRVSAANKKKALAVIAEIAARNFHLDAGDVLDALAEREAAGSTGVGYGVAVPHARLEGLERMRGVFVRLDQPVDPACSRSASASRVTPASSLRLRAAISATTASAWRLLAALTRRAIALRSRSSPMCTCL